MKEKYQETIRLHQFHEHLGIGIYINIYTNVHKYYLHTYMSVGELLVEEGVCMWVCLGLVADHVWNNMWLLYRYIYRQQHIVI